jgi:hypothetical protein
MLGGMKARIRNYELIHYLDYRGWTLTKLSQMLGISHTSIHHKVNGRSPFKLTEVAMIRKALNMSDEDVVRIFIAPAVG